jgi:hypothetical protein
MVGRVPKSNGLIFFFFWGGKHTIEVSDQRHSHENERYSYNMLQCYRTK